MKTYLAIKYHPDARNRDKIEKISEVLKSCSIETFCMFRDKEKWGKVKFDPKELMQMTFEAIDESDFVLVELTETGYGTGIEAGYAYACKKPIVVVAEKGSNITPTLAGIADEVFLYNKIEEINELKILRKSYVRNMP